MSDNNLKNIPFMLDNLEASLDAVERASTSVLSVRQTAELLTADLIGKDLVLIRYSDLQRVAREVPT